MPRTLVALINSGYRGCTTSDGWFEVQMRLIALRRERMREQETELSEEYLLKRRESRGQGTEMYIRE